MYSSSASALHRIVWGDVRLNSDWSVSLGFNEDLIWIADAMSAVADDRQAGGAGYLLGGRSVKDGFDSGPVAEAELRHRRPDEEQPGPGGKIQSEGDDVEEGKEVGADGAE